jgi:hypothetical protein
MTDLPPPTAPAPASAAAASAPGPSPMTAPRDVAPASAQPEGQVGAR